MALFTSRDFCLYHVNGSDVI